MRRWAWCAVLAVTMAARAQEAHAPSPAAGEHASADRSGHEKVDTSTYIVEHVADSNEVEFQVPLYDKEFIIHFLTTGGIEDGNATALLFEPFEGGFRGFDGICFAYGWHANGHTELLAQHLEEVR